MTSKADKDAVKTKKLPADWPVQLIKTSKDAKGDARVTINGKKSRKPSNAQVSSLVPGPVMHACSGSDIQLARGACAQPNLAKGRGRFLVVLPGLLSIHPKDSNKPAASEAASDVASSQAEDAASDSAATGSQDKDETDAATSNSKEKDKTGDNTVVKPVKAAPPMLGKMEQLASDAPVLKVPFPDGRVLTFPGRKMETSSKFMMLTCKSNKGSVACKDVFTSMVVFGNPIWEKNGDEDPSKAEPSPLDSSEVAPLLRRYGGSTQTFDGGREVSKSRMSNSASRKRKSAPVVKKRAVIDIGDESDIEVVEKLGSNDEVVDVDDQEDEYTDDVFAGSDGENPIKPAKRPRRSTASRAKVNYTQSEESEEEEESSEDDEDRPEIIAPRKRKATPAVAKKPTPIDSDEESDIEVHVVGKMASDDKVIEVDDQDDEYTDVGFADSDGATSVERAKRPRRSTAARAKVKYTQSEESEEEEESSEDEEDKVKISAPRKRKATPVVDKKPTPIDTDEESEEAGPDDDEEEVIEIKEQEHDDLDFLGSDEEEPVERAKRPRRSTTSRVNAPNDDCEDESSEEEEGNDEIIDLNEVVTPKKRSAGRSNKLAPIRQADVINVDSEEGSVPAKQTSHNKTPTPIKSPGRTASARRKMRGE